MSVSRTYEHIELAKLVAKCLVGARVEFAATVVPTTGFTTFVVGNRDADTLAKAEAKAIHEMEK